MYILSQGEIGEYKGFPDPSKVRSVDPILVAEKRVRSYSSKQDTFCVLSLFIGMDAPSTFAAMRSSVLLRVPASSIQPILANQPNLVQHISAVLLSIGAIPIDESINSRLQLMNLANQISSFHTDFMLMNPGTGWDLSPRSRANQPRTAMKEHDVPAAQSREKEEVQPCVGRKEGVIKPSKAEDTFKPPKPINVVENGHLSPRFLERDRFAGKCAVRLSTRTMDEVYKIAASRSGIPRLAPGHEDWDMQAIVNERPNVKVPGISPAPVHHFLASCGTTKQALDELERAANPEGEIQTKASREIRRYREIAQAIKNVHTPYQAQVTHGSNRASMMHQLQYDPQLITHPNAYGCGLEIMKKINQREENLKTDTISDLKPRVVTFECKVRQNFIPADMPSAVTHIQYHSKRDDIAAKKEVAGQAGFADTDPILKKHFQSPFSEFPQKATVQMYREGKFRLAKEVGIIPPADKQEKESADSSSSLNSLLSSSVLSLNSNSTDSVFAAKILGKQDNSEANNPAVTWSSTLRAAETSGLVQKATPKFRPTFACDLRTSSAREHCLSATFERHGKQVTKTSHAFSDIVGNDPSAATPASTLQDALEMSFRRAEEERDLQEKGMAERNEPFRTWNHSVRYARQESGMFSILTAPDQRLRYSVYLLYWYKRYKY
jgi:hypothetical protein